MRLLIVGANRCSIGCLHLTDTLGTLCNFGARRGGVMRNWVQMEPSSSMTNKPNVQDLVFLGNNAEECLEASYRYEVDSFKGR